MAKHFLFQFSDDIRAALSLTHGDFGTYYAIATTASAISLLWLGKLPTQCGWKTSIVDFVRPVLSGHSFQSDEFNHNAGVWLYLLRMFGQGMMTHVYSTAMARRYVVARGRATSIAQLGHNQRVSGPAGRGASCSVRPADNLDYITRISINSVAPFSLLTRRTTLQDGEGIDGIQATDQTQDNANQRPASVHWQGVTCLSTCVLLAILWLVAVPSFVLTGQFHQLFRLTPKVLHSVIGPQAMCFTPSLWHWCLTTGH